MPPHELTPMLCSMNFADNFWGREQKGVKTLLARMRHAKETCEDIRHMYEARALAAEEYSRKLQRIQKSKLAKDETGKIKTTLQTAQEDTQTEAQQFQQLAQTIRVELGSPLAEFITKQREARKLIQKAVQDVYNQRQLQIHYVLRARDKYNNECMRIKTLRQDKENQKSALSRAAASAKSLYAEYESMLGAAQETIQVWNREWKSSCGKFQHLEEERINFLRESLSQFTYLQMTYAQAQTARWEGLTTLVNSWDCREELDTYVGEQGTGRDIPEIMDYMIMFEQQESDKTSNKPTDNDQDPPSPKPLGQDSMSDTASQRSTVIPVAVKSNVPKQDNNIQSSNEDNQKLQFVHTPPKALPNLIIDEPSPNDSQISAINTIRNAGMVSNKEAESRQETVRKSAPPATTTNSDQSTFSRKPTHEPIINRRNSVLETSSTAKHSAAAVQEINFQSTTDSRTLQDVKKPRQERGSLVRVSSSRPINVDMKDARSSLSRTNSFVSTFKSTDSKVASAHSSLENILQRFETGQIGRGTNRIRGTLSDRNSSRRTSIGTWQSRMSNDSDRQARVSLHETTSKSVQSPFAIPSTVSGGTTKDSYKDNYGDRGSRQSTPRMRPQQPIPEEPVYAAKDQYSDITGVGYQHVAYDEAPVSQALEEEDEYPHADLESQLDDMISLLNDGIDYQRDLTKNDTSPFNSPEFAAEASAIHNDRAMMWVQALFDYQAQDDEELSFSAGDLIAILETGDDGWWHGELWDADTNRSLAMGTVPRNFVEEVEVA